MYLTLGYDFDKPIILNFNLRLLEIWVGCDYQIIVPDKQNIRLKSFCDNKKLFDNLPNSVGELSVYYSRRQKQEPLNNLPNSTKLNE